MELPLDLQLTGLKLLERMGTSKVAFLKWAAYEIVTRIGATPDEHTRLNAQYMLRYQDPFITKAEASKKSSIDSYRLYGFDPAISTVAEALNQWDEMLKTQWKSRIKLVAALDVYSKAKRTPQEDASHGDNLRLALDDHAKRIDRVREATHRLAQIVLSDMLTADSIKNDREKKATIRENLSFPLSVMDASLPVYQGVKSLFKRMTLT